MKLTSYDRRTAFQRRGSLHYDSPSEDAAWIASEVIRHGKSLGWIEDELERPVAAEIERTLAKFSVGYIGHGSWAHVPGGTRFFQK